MSKMIALAAIAFLSMSASAEKFTCYFNEPFYTVKLDSASGAVTWTGVEDRQDQKSYATWLIDNSENVGAEFAIGKVKYTLVIDLTQKGSDTMSEFVYPTQGRLVNYYGKNKDLVTGCFSNKRAKTCPKGASCG